MMFPLVRELAADEVPVAVTCGVLGFSRQAYYQWLADPVSDRDWADAHLVNAIIDIHAADPEFGYRLIADELARRGWRVGENRVARLCREQCIVSAITRSRRTTKTPGPPAHDDLVERDFTVDRLDAVWLTDITEHPTNEGTLYVCAVKDACSKRIVGYALGERMTARLAVAALELAIARRSPEDTVVVHSDRGSQFRSQAYTAALEEAGLVGSMGRVGAAGDNAPMESFFALLQRNVLDRKRWTSREELTHAIITWIERTYHRRRRQRGLGRLTPIEYETLAQPAPLAA